MENTNYKILFEEYRELEKKIKSIAQSNKRGQPYTYIDSKDSIRMGDLEKRLVNECQNKLEELNPEERYQIKKWLAKIKNNQNLARS